MIAEEHVKQATTFGVDIGYTAAAVIVWGVIAPTANLGPGSLAGNYAGASAGAAVGAGLGANALIGGSNQQIALQPLSIEGQTGLTLRQGLRQSSCVIAGSAIAGARSWMNDLSEGRVSSFEEIAERRTRSSATSDTLPHSPFRRGRIYVLFAMPLRSSGTWA